MQAGPLDCTIPLSNFAEVCARAQPVMPSSFRHSSRCLHLQQLVIELVGKIAKAHDAVQLATWRTARKVVAAATEEAWGAQKTNRSTTGQPQGSGLAGWRQQRWQER